MVSTRSASRRENQPSSAAAAPIDFTAPKWATDDTPPAAAPTTASSLVNIRVTSLTLSSTVAPLTVLAIFSAWSHRVSAALSKAVRMARPP